MKKPKTPLEMPTSAELRGEIKRVGYKKQYKSIIRSTFFSLVAVAAVAVLVATLLLPVFQIYGSSMTPTLSDGEIAVAVKTSKFETGDVIAFYLNNKILIKRVIAHAGQWVDIDEDGTVYVYDEKGKPGAPLDEPYVTEKSLGDCDLEFPYQVPESRVFVMGDHRSVSLDSRNSAIGCVADEQVVGKIIFKVWPLPQFGTVK